MSEPGAPPAWVLDALAARPARGVPVAWWTLKGEHCGVVCMAVDRDGLLCAGDESARLFVERSGCSRPEAFAAYMKQGGPVAVERAR